MKYLTRVRYVMSYVVLAAALSPFAVSQAEPPAVSIPTAPPSVQGLPDFTDLVAANGAAVVNISTTQKISQAGRPALPPGMEIPDLPEGSPFNDLFKHFFGEGQGGEAPREFDAQSLGSGFIVSPEGYVITNNHVVKNADKIIVRLNDRRELTAKVIGGDERSDIALLKIEAENLPVVTMGDSTKLKVGEWVLAIGSPFGFDHTATAGIVSATGRSLPRESYVPFIQTDVAINPGNSGGPLFNLQGEVIGVNSQIFSRTGGFMGLSFAIPIDMAMDVADQLRTKGSVTRGWLGILIQEVTSDLAKSFGMSSPEGALVAKVLADSPSEKAGLQVGDVVVEFGGTKIVESADLPRVVGKSKVGVDVPVKLVRKGQTLTLAVKIEELPKEEELALSQGAPDVAIDNRLAITVIDLTPEQRKLVDTKKGVLVENVDSGPAQKAGIQRGDIIEIIDGKDIVDVAGFNTIVKDLPEGQPLSVLVRRGEGAQFLALEIPTEEASAQDDTAKDKTE